MGAFQEYIIVMLTNIVLEFPNILELIKNVTFL